MKTSVVITTYNGEKHIIELLDSILGQSRLPDEVLIFDDVSKDNTPIIINEYIKKHNLSNWKLICNECNVGWELNFKNGLLKAIGDVIYPCDQDDIWHLDKIEKMTLAFEKNADILLLVSGYHAFCENGAQMVIQQPVNKHQADNMISKVVLDEHYYDTGRPGCTMALHRELLPLFNDVWRPGMAHDAVLWSISILLERLYLYDETFIEFRRHENNTSNKMYHGVNFKIADITRTQAINKWFLESYSEHKDLISNCNIWCQYRYELLVNKKIWYWFKLLNYRKYYLSFRKIFGDIFYFFCSV